LCDGWGLITYCDAADAATGPNRLQRIEIRIPNEDRIVKTVFRSAENRCFWIQEACLPANTKDILSFDIYCNESNGRELLKKIITR
jgi:hypothetical protein